MSTNTARVIGVLNEKNVEYEFILVNLGKGEHKLESFLAINPFGQIPAFEDGDLKLFESRAITKYIAYKYMAEGTDLLHMGDLNEGATVDLWVEVEAQQYNPQISVIVYECLIKKLFGDVTDETKVEACCAKVAPILDVYEDRLKTCKYLAGEKFSLADLNHCAYTEYLMRTPKADLITSRPHVLAWWKDISSRPAWVKTAAGMQFPHIA